MSSRIQIRNEVFKAHHQEDFLPLTRLCRAVPRRIFVVRPDHRSTHRLEQGEAALPALARTRGENLKAPRLHPESPFALYPERRENDANPVPG